MTTSQSSGGPPWVVVITGGVVAVAIAFFGGLFVGQASAPRMPGAAATPIVAPAPAPIAPVEVRPRVVGVHDGDTVTILVDGDRAEKIRLHGIDAPEKGQPFGTQAKQALSDLCFGEHVDVERLDVDKYGRTIAVLRIGGRNLNEAMLRDGMAWHYKQYDNSILMAAAEQRARELQIGLWGDAKPIPPWEWRHGERGAPVSPPLSAATSSPPPLANSLSSQPSPTSAPSVPAKTHWLNTSTGARHNSSCRWYGATKKGRPCTASEGHACGQCGG